MMQMATMMTILMNILILDMIIFHGLLQEPFECKDIEKAILEIREQEVFLIIIIIILVIIIIVIIFIVILVIIIIVVIIIFIICVPSLLDLIIFAKKGQTKT